MTEMPKFQHVNYFKLIQQFFSINNVILERIYKCTYLYGTHSFARIREIFMWYRSFEDHLLLHLHVL